LLQKNLKEFIDHFPATKFSINIRQSRPSPMKKKSLIKEQNC
jgi:hypothetical protein